MISKPQVTRKKVNNHRETNRHNLCNSSEIAFKNSKMAYKNSRQRSDQVLLPARESTLQTYSKNINRNIHVTGATENRKSLTNIQESWYLADKEETISNKENLSICFEDSYDKVETSASEKYMATLQNTQEVDSFTLLEMIERELRRLKEMAPAVSHIVSQLSDVLTHYKVCSRCNAKFQIFLPHVLFRIQDLVKYVSRKSGKNRVLIDDSNPLDLTFLKSLKLCTANKNFQVKEDGFNFVRIGKLEKIEVLAITDIKPGIQIQLSVKPEKGKKRTFETILCQKITFKPSFNRLFTLSCLTEILYRVVVIPLKSLPERGTLFERKHELYRAKGVAVAAFLIVLATKPFKLTNLIAVPVNLVTRIETYQLETYPKELASYEERAQVLNTNLAILITQRNCDNIITRYFPRKIVKISKMKPVKSEDSSLNVSELIRDFVNDTKETKVQDLRGKDLETEIKNLKSLMLEVHKNQIELSKVLVEKKVYSQPIIKLIDPNMLEEENLALKRAAEMEIQALQKKNSSTEALQMTIDEVKRKCKIKNRMIVALLKGLRSNVPKEWWEQLVDGIFSESQPIEEFDSERVNEFIRQTSLYLLQRDEAETVTLPSAPTQDSLFEGLKSKPNSKKLSTMYRKKASRKYLPDEIDQKRRELKKETARLMNLKPSSTVMRNMLYDDSHKGVGVFDLFVAAKRAKDKLNLLAKNNTEVCYKMNMLNREVKIMKMNYAELAENLNIFFEKMSSDSVGPPLMYTLTNQKDNCENNEKSKGAPMETPQEEEKYEETFYIVEEIKSQPMEQVKDEKHVFCDSKTKDNGYAENSVANCSICLKNAENKLSGQVTQKFESEKNQISALNSMVASSSYDVSKVSDQQLSSIGKCQDENCRFSNLNNISALLDSITAGNKREYSPKKENELKPGHERSLKLKTTNPHMNNYLFELSKNKKTSHDRGKVTKDTHESRFSHYKDIEQVKLHDDEKDSVSEGDSAFEEALAEPAFDVKTTSNILCFGDLKKDINKKSVSTLTTECEKEISWMGKLAEDIKSKLKNLKANFSKETLPTDVTEQPEKTMSGGLEFTVSTNTPLGVFDVTVKQYKQPSKKPDEKSVTNYEMAKSSTFEKEKADNTKANLVQNFEYYWADEISQSSIVELSSEERIISEEEEMEEFLEVYVDNQNTNIRTDKGDFPLTKGVMLKAMFKQNKLPAFEIEKYQPKYFVQEILPKQEKIKYATVERYENDEKNENAENCDVIDDLVIYIQLEVEEEEEKEKQLEEIDQKKILVGCSSRESAPIYVKRLPTTKTENQVSHRELVHVVESKEKKIAQENNRSEKIIVINKLIELNRQEEDEEEEEKVIKMSTTEKQYLCSSTKLFDETLRETNSDVSNISKKRKFLGSSVIKYLYKKLKADVFFVQHQNYFVNKTDVRISEKLQLVTFLDSNSVELKTALDLIHEIETNVVRVKLSDAILILPNLECELRKHLQNKIKGMSDKDSMMDRSVDDFFSAVDFWSEEERFTNHSDNSDERLNTLFTLLSSLEEAVKMNEKSTNDFEVCENNSSKIYNLLHSLTDSIKDLENGANVKSLAETLNIASNLDSAVREFDGIVKNHVDSYAKSKTNEKYSENLYLKEAAVSDQMKSIRKKVFKAVEEESIKIEKRLEKNFDRIGRLERENEEAMKFVEAFVEKTAKRITDLGALKNELETLSLALKELYERLLRMKKKGKKRRDEIKFDKPRGESKRLQIQKKRSSQSDYSLTNVQKVNGKKKEKSAANNRVKSTTMVNVTEKEKLEKEMNKKMILDNKFEDYALTSSLKDLRKIGKNSLYLAWSKPKGPFANMVSGYEIFVNGVINQKVRNHRRTQAILYSVDLSKKVEIQLYGLLENYDTKVLLSSVTHYDEMNL